jgi:hypothetical protein
MRQNIIVGSLSGLVALSAVGFAWADGPAPGASTAPAGPATTPSAGSAAAGAPGAANPKEDEARQRYQRGVQLYGEANYEAARVEFERAYQLNPSYRILYNIGLCYEQLGDYVQANAMFKRYLQVGGPDITPERRAEVDKELTQIQPRIARATLILNTASVEILIDDVCATDQDSATANCGVTTGLTRRVLMNPGRRRITVRKAGYLPETQVVTVAGSDNIDVRIDLKPLPKAGEKASNPWIIPTIAGWTLTAGGLVTATILGVSARNTADEQRALVEAFPANRAAIDAKRSDWETLATATDVTWILTGVVAAGSAFLTWKAVSWKREGSGTTGVFVGPGSVRVGGTF